MRTSRISRVRLISTDAGPIEDFELLAQEHPSLCAEIADACGVCDAVFDVGAWASSRDFRTWNESVETSASDAITVRGAGRDVAAAACEVLTRYQRYVGRRNAASSAPVFDAVLRAHAGLHDCHKPLVRADFDHALDTWQWMLRLDADASLAAQLAALFHDVERLESEADARVEQHAPDYQAFKDAHAKKGGDRAHDALLLAGVDAATAERVRHLVAKHERRGPDREIALLNDADALSFFSLNSAGYIDYFGPEQTEKKVRYTVGRMSADARARLALVRLRADVAPFLAKVLGTAAPSEAA